jgi:hypothetical protein
VTSLHIVVLHTVQLLLRFLLPNSCLPGLAASLPRSHTRSSVARATCPLAAQRLHSSALRAARSRTRRHVALHQLPYATARMLTPHLRSARAHESMLQRHRIAAAPRLHLLAGVWARAKCGVVERSQVQRRGRAEQSAEQRAA